MKRATALRVSLFVSLGLVPLACGGTTLRNGGDDDTAGTGSGGSSGSGTGMTSRAGSPTKPSKPKPTGNAGSGGAFPVVGGAGGTGTGGSIAALCSPSKLDPLSGLVLCGQGFAHRPQAVTCDVAQAEAGGAGGEGSLPRASGQGCNDDTDCRGFQLGYCEEYSDDCFQGLGGQTWACRSGCTEDADCGNGQICLCDGSAHGGYCENSTCRTDADCGAGLLCASLFTSTGDESFTCTDPRDECHSDRECDTGEGCRLERPVPYRQCVETSICGRPFLVQAEARVAPVVTDRAWSALQLEPRIDHLTSAERSAQAAHWTKMGQMEHASIAAFARFQLQLLALGAPPELVEACTQALADETAHTKLCFSLASAYAGRKVGPGALDVEQSLSATSLADIVDLVILEGCFGETSAALEALELRDTASDPVIVSAYAQIAADEQRHAELAFRFVQWALSRDDGRVRQRVARAVASPPTQLRDVLTVSLPCLEALLRLPEPATSHCSKSANDLTTQSRFVDATHCPRTRP